MYDFEHFWNDYDKKVGKDKCITKWLLLSPEEHLKIKLHVPGFVASRRNKQFRPNPLSYLNGKMWLDENVGTEEKQVYRTPSDKPISDYEPKEFDRAKGINHMRDKLKANYENGTPIKDWGGVYTALLIEKCGMDILKDTERELRSDVKREATRPRNRFEEPYSGNLESDIRDKILNWQLKKWREEKREIWREL